MKQKKSLGAYRKQIYSHLGITIDSPEHKALAPILKDLWEEAPESAGNTEPVKHEITCPNCLRKTTKTGSKPMKSYRKRAFKAKERKEKS